MACKKCPITLPSSAHFNLPESRHQTMRCSAIRSTPGTGSQRASCRTHTAASNSRSREKELLLWVRRQGGKRVVTGLHSLLRRIVAFVVTLEGSRFAGQREKLIRILTVFTRLHGDPEFQVALIRTGVCHARSDVHFSCRSCRSSAADPGSLRATEPRLPWNAT